MWWDGGASKRSGGNHFAKYNYPINVLNSHSVMSIMSQKSWRKQFLKKRKKPVLLLRNPSKAKGDTLQCRKFKCNTAGEEEGLLTHWSPAQGCLLWLQQLVGTRLAFTSTRRTGSLQAPTSSSWGVSMRKSPRISSFPLIYYHFSLCLFQDHCWVLTGQGLKEMLPFSYWSLLARRLLPAGSEPGGREGTGSLRTKSRCVHAGALLTCASPAPGNLNLCPLQSFSTGSTRGVGL